jgi:hypothetical protein
MTHQVTEHALRLGLAHQVVEHLTKDHWLRAEIC